MDREGLEEEEGSLEEVEGGCREEVDAEDAEVKVRYGAVMVL